MGTTTEKDCLPKVSREKRGTVSNEASRERSVLEGQYQIGTHTNRCALTRTELSGLQFGSPYQLPLLSLLIGRGVLYVFRNVSPHTSVELSIVA